MPGTTAYYEPFNERRWFDASKRGVHIDATHLGVSNYWSEYEGLEDLGQYFNERWKFEHLYMSEYVWNPEMQRYIELLIERASGRPVLQFNEIDMRLGWLRARFPGARILHLFRHPRDQWCSTLPRREGVLANLTVGEFRPVDKFYLLPWARDLKQYFPFLTLDSSAHPYELFYQIWKLSYAFGRYHADVSVALEDIVSKPHASIASIVTALDVREYDLDSLVRLVEPVPSGKWRQYADDGWFAAIEARVDGMLTEYCRPIMGSPQMSLQITPSDDQAYRRSR